MVTEHGQVCRGRGWSISGKGRGSEERPEEPVRAWHVENGKEVSLAGMRSEVMGPHRLQ